MLQLRCWQDGRFAPPTARRSPGQSGSAVALIPLLRGYKLALGCTNRTPLSSPPPAHCSCRIFPARARQPHSAGFRCVPQYYRTPSITDHLRQGCATRASPHLILHIPEQTCPDLRLNGRDRLCETLWFRSVVSVPVPKLRNLMSLMSVPRLACLIGSQPSQMAETNHKREIHASEKLHC